MPPKKAPAKKLHVLAPEVRVGHKITDVHKKTFIVGKQFATGGFGRIHTCTEEGKKEEMVMKIEPSTNGPLLTEVVVFNRILKPEHLEAYKKKKKLTRVGLPWLIANGFFNYNDEKMRYMIIPKYAMSLEGAREANGGSLTVKDSFTVANCVLGALEYLHDVDYTHADVKAANILLEKSGVYSTAVLVDFGLAHKTTNNVDKPDKKRAHNGTCIFTSTDAHRGNNPSYRGDLEILAYNLVMWLTGTLPWMALEASPDKVFEAKQKFVAGLPGTLEKELKSSSSTPGVIQCITGMFKMVQDTHYNSKLDMERLRKLVAAAIASSSGSSSSRTPAKTSTRTNKKRVVQESDEEDDVVREPTPPKRNRAQTSKEEEPKKSSRSSRRRQEPEKIEDEEEEEEIVIPRSTRTRRQPETPRMRLGITSSTASQDSTAKKIEQKYKRLSMSKASRVPVTVTVSPGSPSDAKDDHVETIELKTPAVKKTKQQGGISSATKASPTELRRVPGMRNFPVGRRSIIINETAARYKKKLAARDPVIDDDGSSSSEI